MDDFEGLMTSWCRELLYRWRKQGLRISIGPGVVTGTQVNALIATVLRMGLNLAHGDCEVRKVAAHAWLSVACLSLLGICCGHMSRFQWIVWCGSSQARSAKKIGMPSLSHRQDIEASSSIDTAGGSGLFQDAVKKQDAGNLDTCLHSLACCN